MSFNKLQFFRFVLFAILISFLSQLGQTGISLLSLLSSIAIGMYVAGRALKKSLSAKKVAILHLFIFLALYLSLKALNWLAIVGFSGIKGADFFIPVIRENVEVLLIFYLTSLISTWLFWTKSWALILEVISTVTLLVVTLGAHREYHVDAPKEVSSLSWKLALLQHYDIQPQHLFMAIGAALFLCFCSFALVASNRSLFGQSEKVKSTGKKPILSIATGIFILSLVIGLTFWQINSHYNLNLSRMANGVGSADNLEQGQSNLGFHEAVSSTKQPAALVRLEGDYDQNPWKPMLYFREGALSEFNGRELVKASRKFDSDIPIISPGQTYLGDINKSSEHRNKLVQSIYMLSDNNTLFAVDFPQKITPIKNPFPEKFKYSYQATSLAPIYSPNKLKGLKVGNTSWDDETWQHYLRAPGSKSKALHLPIPDQNNPTLDSLGEDLRYLAMAEKLSEGISDPLALAGEFAKYLSEESIYTKEPGHQVTEKGDPVAPYLFAKDKRGFCVHFAHSMVYLLRLIGIPARIATGYLTELTYAKDGHILLQNGDRHAWAEVYVEDYGWIVFDVTPSRVENQETLVPDESLLQELMSKLTPVEELLVPEIKDINEEHSIKDLIKKLSPTAIYIVYILIALFVLSKLWLRYAYLLPFDTKRKAILAYQSFASTMVDLNHPRYYGETRKEYSKRLNNQEINCDELTALLEKASYSKLLNEELKISELVNRSTKKFNLIKKVISFLNPSSILWHKKW